jgi:AcrR family transcriptional regulator
MPRDRATTRRRLLDAATAVVARRGFHAATVDAIAAEAGYSVGAIYSNFGGKDELFLAVFDEHAAWFERVLADASAPTTAIESLLAERQQFLVFISFWSYAVRDAAVRRRLATRMRRFREHVGRRLVERAEAAGAAAPGDPEQIATLALALFRGIALERLADPKAVPDGLLAGALDALTAPAAP